MITIASNYTVRDSNWESFLIFQGKKKFSIQFNEQTNLYQIWGYDGPEAFTCVIYKNTTPPEVIAAGYTQEQNDLDKTDFETNYKDLANAQIDTGNVTTQFEQRDKTLKLFHGESDVNDSGDAAILVKVPGTPGSGDGRWISSGMAFFDVHTPGDKILGVFFTDEDNLLGYGAGFLVGTYTDLDADEINQGWAIPPSGWVKAEAIGGYGFAPSGFYIKVTGKKAGISPSGKFYCNLEWGKTE